MILKNSLSKFNNTIRFLFRRPTLLICLLAVAGLIYTVYEAASISQIDEPETQIQLFTHLGVFHISKARLRIEYHGGGRDTLLLFMQFTDVKITKQTDSGLINNAFQLGVPRSLKRKWEYSDYVGLTPAYSWRISRYGDYNYQFIQSNSYSLTEEFEGDIFGTNPQDIHLDLDVNVDSGEEKASIVPLEIEITNISPLQIASLYPQPTEQYPHAVIYAFPSIMHKLDKINIGRNIILTATKRTSAQSNQFWIYLLGTVAGIFASIIAAILLQFAQQIESLQPTESTAYLQHGQNGVPDPPYINQQCEQFQNPPATPQLAAIALPCGFNEPYPYRHTDLVHTLKPYGLTVNNYDIQCIIEVYSIKEKAEFCQMPTPSASARYSVTLITWILEQYQSNPAFFKECRERVKDSRNVAKLPPATK